MSDFELKHFLPYILNQSAERSSLVFRSYYQDRYGMLRTEWRVLFHLGRYGDMTAREICDRAALHKTNVSRAVRALEEKRLLKRTTLPSDQRNELLSWTGVGRKTSEDLGRAAEQYNRQLLAPVSQAEQTALHQCLARIADLPQAKNAEKVWCIADFSQFCRLNKWLGNGLTPTLPRPAAQSRHIRAR